MAIASLEYFCIEAWKILEPATPLAWNWHHSLICEELTLVRLGLTKGLLINVMPRSLKSFIVSVCFPCWEWLHAPHTSYLCLSYASPLAYELSQKRRRIIESEWYQSLSRGLCKLIGDKNRITEYENVSRGVMASRGLEGSVTGVGALRIIYDDPNNPESVESEVVRDRTLKNFKDYSITRRNDPKLSAVIVVMQRTHRQDVSGYILEKLKNWRVLILPTRSLTQETFEFPISKKVVHRQPGELLHPERFGEDEDKEAKTTLGAYLYAGRHQQQPAPAEGGIFPNKWHYFDLEQMPNNRMLALSVDCSFGSKSATASYVAIGLWAIAYPYFYKIDITRERLNFLETVKAITAMIDKWQPTLGFIPTKLVEAKANGQAVLDTFSETIPGFIPIKVTEGDKKSRAIASSPVFQSGHVLLWKGRDWTDYTMELEGFPTYGTDDQVDETSQLINYFSTKGRHRHLPASSSSYGSR